MVVGKAKVIDHETGVVHAEAPAYQLPGSLLAQRLRGNHEVIDWRDLAGDAPLQLAEVAVAGQHHKRCTHGAVPGLYLRRIFARIPSDPGVFVHPDAGLARGTREPEDVVQRVQRHRLGIPEPAEERRRCHHLLHFGLIERPAVRVVVALGQRVGEFLRPVAVTLLVDTDDLPFLQVALYTMLPNAALNLFFRILRKIPQHP